MITFAQCVAETPCSGFITIAAIIGLFIGAIVFAYMGEKKGWTKGYDKGWDDAKKGVDDHE